MSTKKPTAKKPEPKHPAPVAAKVEKAAPAPSPELPPEVLADPQLTYPPREA